MTRPRFRSGVRATQVAPPHVVGAALGPSLALGRASYCEHDATWVSSLWQPTSATVHVDTSESPVEQLVLLLQRQLALKVVTDLQHVPPDGRAHDVAVEPEFSELEQLHEVVPDWMHERFRHAQLV